MVHRDPNSLSDDDKAVIERILHEPESIFVDDQYLYALAFANLETNLNISSMTILALLSASAGVDMTLPVFP